MIGPMSDLMRLMALGYTEPLNIEDTIWTVEEYLSHVETGMIIDDDGYGYPVAEGLVNKEVLLEPGANDPPPEATHVVWYNR